ncbi:MAG: BCD family MFS transporter [Xenococcaceae cyanobacterium MO_188.B19]|nr:BCD family MFS transporter [Xenococcaceae cyanobacterium MO_188.B19]
MNSDNFIQPPSPKANPKRSLGVLTTFRLGLFNLGLGLMAVLTLAVLNRVMISELAIPGTITAGVIALKDFVAPARVWFGQLSDNKPLFGKHRTSYVLIGITVVGIAVFLAVQSVWQIGAIVRANGEWLLNFPIIGWTAILAMIMVVYGLAVSSSSTPFTALLVDISEEDSRSKLVAVVWSMLLVGIIIGGITGKKILDGIETASTSQVASIPLENLQAPINYLFSFVPFVVIILAVVATWGIEKKYSYFSFRSTNGNGLNSQSSQVREDNISFGSALKILTTSRQTSIFFSFLFLLNISLFLQEAVLEPYGGEVFNMSISDTTLLNSFWGTGILVGYSVTGFLLVSRWGKKLTTKIGCYLVAISFLLIILAGFTQQETILKFALVLFGLTSGVALIGGISLMLDLTAAETAGTFIGAWGMAQAISRASATFLGGIILDIGKYLFNDRLVFAYGLVFAIQAVVMIFAIMILNRVNVQEFQETTSRAIATVMEGDLDG